MKENNYRRRFCGSKCHGTFLLYRIRVSKACIFFSTCQIAQFKATICRRCPCQPSTTDTSISPILLRRLLANVSANSLRSNSAPTFALTHKIGQKSPIVCLCLSARTPSANCYLIVVQFDKCNLGYVLLTP